MVDVEEGVESLLSGGPLPEEYVLLQVLSYENQIDFSSNKKI